jgi:hypothetical protein
LHLGWGHLKDCQPHPQWRASHCCTASDQHIWRLPLAPQSAPRLFGLGLLLEAKAELSELTLGECLALAFHFPFISSGDIVLTRYP